MVNQFISRILISTFKIITIATGTTMIPTEFATADTSSTDYIFLLDNARQSCQQIGEDYQEVRGFETDNFYVNICKKEDIYYYLGEAKTGTIGTIFVPANVLATGEMYRANNGNVSYIVTILPSQAVLTIERNGAQVAIESSQLKQCLDSSLSLPVSITNQIYYPMSDARILPNHDYIELKQIEIIDLLEFEDFNSVSEYSLQTILNISKCDR